MTHTLIVPTPIGNITVSGTATHITDITLPNATSEMPVRTQNTAEVPLLLHTAAQQIAEYFDRKRIHFDLPLAPRGTPFCRSVYDALLTIPYGETRSYAWVAAQIGNPKACRAVGAANRVNPIPLIIPCHRVIAADGRIGGFSDGTDVKRRILAVEGITIHS